MTAISVHIKSLKNVLKNSFSVQILVLFSSNYDLHPRHRGFKINRDLFLIIHYYIFNKGCNSINKKHFFSARNHFHAHIFLSTFSNFDFSDLIIKFC